MVLPRVNPFSGAAPADAGSAPALPTVIAHRSAASAVGATPDAPSGGKPTAVPAHGSRAGFCGRNRVAPWLRHGGHPMRATADPRRGLPTDTAAVEDVPLSTDSPITMSGHSCGDAGSSAAAVGSGAPGAASVWNDIPSRHLVAEPDCVLATGPEPWTADLIGAHPEQISASHPGTVNRPGTVTRLIEDADRNTLRNTLRNTR